MRPTLARVLTRLLLALLALLSVPVGLMIWTFAGNPEMVDGQRLPGATLIQDGYVASYLLDAGAGKVALIDAGNDPSGAALLAALRDRQRAPADVVAILLTHGHPDHVAACALFPNAKVYAGAPELPAMRGEVAYQGPLPRLFGASPASGCDAIPVEDGQTIPLGPADPASGTQPAATAFLIPGHTLGSVAWLYQNVLYLGDSADATTSGEMVGSKWLFSDDTAQNADSLRRLADRLQPQPLEHLAFAHTGTLPGSALQRFAGR